eukprot:TRINITY_DN1863_c0_g1_i1.p2 TRINITY_DN1863_c0_g1~~TRINITY_DN1863_c0_g1_i1.p2  ORF type:complete len:136 (-),score=14.35 TRINITY_DN1863_c0_g1_i1:926-1333(-)
MLEETKCQYSVHTQYEEQLINMFYFSTHLIMSPLYLAIVFYAIYSRWTNRNSLMFWQKWFLLLLSLGSFCKCFSIEVNIYAVDGVNAVDGDGVSALMMLILIVLILLMMLMVLVVLMILIVNAIDGVNAIDCVDV